MYECHVMGHLRYHYFYLPLQSCLVILCACTNLGPQPRISSLTTCVVSERDESGRKNKLNWMQISTNQLDQSTTKISNREVCAFVALLWHRILKSAKRWSLSSSSVEIRSHGVGYYAFSTDEEKRQEQLNLLNQLKEQVRQA